MILSIIYSVEDNSQIEITNDDGSFTTSKYPTNINAVNRWEADGGVIAPYDPYYGITDEQLREQKYALNADLAQEQIEAAEAAPVIGTALSDRKAVKENKRRTNRAKRNAAMTDADDAMADHVDSVYDVQDQADDEVENLDRAGLIAWDGSTIVWPVWTPPAV